MLRICLLLLLLCFHEVNGQQKSKYLLQAESLAGINIQQAIEVARKAHQQSVQKNDTYNVCLSGLFLSNTYRKFGNYNPALFYDSITLLHARRQPNLLLLQKAANSYTRNFIEQLQIPQAEVLLANNKELLTGHTSSETCTWYEMKALCFFNRLRFDSAILTCRTASAVAQQLRDSTSIMHLQMLLGKFYAMKLQPDSVRLVYKTLRYFEHHKDYRHAAQAANIIGFVLETVNSPDKAIQFYDLALAYNDLTHDVHEAAQTRMHMGDAWLAKNEPGVAKAFFEDGYKYFTAVYNEKGIASVSIRLGKMYTEANQYDSAWWYFRIAENINEHLQSQALKIGLSGWKALLLNKQGNYKEADSLMESAIKSALRTQDKEQTSTIHKRLIDEKIITEQEVTVQNRFSRTSQSTKAHQSPPADTQHAYYQQLETINWHTGGTETTKATDLEKSQRQVLQVDAEYKVPKLKDSLQTERRDKNTAKQQADTHAKITWFVIVLLIVIAAALFLQYKNRRRAERQKVQAEALQKEIHHRVTNNLSVINRMIALAGKASEDKLPVAVLQSRVNSIVLIHQLLYNSKTVTGKVSLQAYFDELCNNITAVFEAEKSIKVNVYTPVEIESTLAEKLGLIVNELVTNSFKYAFTYREQGNIQVYAKENNDQLYLTVSDNGCGLPITKQQKGYGTRLIQGLSNELKGKYSYHNDNGTTFELTIPLTA